MAATYQNLVDSLNQIEHDQSLFETELGNELKGALHSELVELGGKMIEKFKAFVDMGKFFAEQQQPDVLSKMCEAIQEYESLLMPPKVCWGYCPCLKSARSGPEYEKRYLLVRSKVVAGTFLAHAILIENRAEKINMDSMHFADYTNKMNNIFNVLSSISTKGNDTARENAKNEILGAFDMINRFMKSFEEETTEFRGDCRRRLASTNELLTSRPSTEGSVISRRILVKAQSSLQEIMNSVAQVSMNKSKESITELERLAQELKIARTSQVNEFNALEDRMHACNIMDALYRLREDMEIVHSDANSKIRDSLKRWNTVKAQSTPRPVVEYQEEVETSIGTLSVPNGNKIVSDVGKTVSNVGKELKGVGKDFTNDFKKITGIPTTVAMDVVKLTTGAVDSSVNLVTSGVMKTKKKTTELLGLTDNNPHPSDHKYTAIMNGGKPLTGQSNSKMTSNRTSSGGFL